MKTAAQAFRAKAAELMPMHEELLDFPDEVKAPNGEMVELLPTYIADYIFSNHGEYLGGMAAVIATLVEIEAYKTN